MPFNRYEEGTYGTKLNASTKNLANFHWTDVEFFFHKKQVPYFCKSFLWNVFDPTSPWKEKISS